MRSRPSRDPRRQKAVRTAVGLVACLVWCAGCAAVLGFEDTTVRAGNDGGPNEGGPGRDGDITPDGGTSLTTTPASVIVRVGKTADITVDVARGGDATGPITIRLTNLPSGVTATTATLDPASSSGKVTLSAAATAALGAKTITLTAEGTPYPPAQLPLLVADAPGALDKTWGTDGLASDLSKGVGATFYALAQQSDGPVLAGGGGLAGSPQAGWMLRRFAANGTPDAAFNAAAAAPAPADGDLRALAVDATGKIICVGASTQGVGPQLLTVARFLPTGAIDSGFAGGVVRFSLAEGALGSIGLGLAIQADGSVVVVGSRRDAGNVESGVITRYKMNGTRDTAFNGGNTIVIPTSRLVGVSILASGAVLAGGSSTSGALPSYFLARRNPQGAADPTFGTGGTAAFGNTYRANGFALLPGGSLAVVGDVQQGTPAYTAGVANDQGVATFARAFAVSAAAGFYGIAIQDDKRFIAAGHTAVANGEARVERILTDGNKDTTFGASGTATIKTGGAGAFDVTLFAAAVQADGRILVAGNRSNAGASVYRLWP